MDDFLEKLKKTDFGPKIVDVERHSGRSCTLLFDLAFKDAYDLYYKSVDRLRIRCSRYYITLLEPETAIFDDCLLTLTFKDCDEPLSETNRSYHRHFYHSYPCLPKQG